MFLTNTSYNNDDISEYDIMNEGYNIVLEAERSRHRINMSMAKLEHAAIINEDYSLLSEGLSDWWAKIKSWFKKIWDAITGFFKKLWEKIKSIARKIKNFIFGSKDKNKKVKVNEDTDKKIKDIKEKTFKGLKEVEKRTQDIIKGNNEKDLVTAIDEFQKELNNESTNEKEVSVEQAQKLLTMGSQTLEDIAKEANRVQSNFTKQVNSQILNNESEENQKKAQQAQKLQEELQKLTTTATVEITKEVSKMASEIEHAMQHGNLPHIGDKLWGNITVFVEHNHMQDRKMEDVIMLYAEERYPDWKKDKQQRRNYLELKKLAVKLSQVTYKQYIPYREKFKPKN